MYSDILEQIGLSPNEAKIYETLIHIGQASTSQISVKAQVHRRNVYDAMERLLNKGLVFRIIGRGENMYEAVNPDKLMEIIKEKEIMLNQVLPTFRKIYYATPPQDAAFIYHGLEGYKNYLRDLTRICEDTYFTGAKGNWITSKMTMSLEDDFKKALKKNKKKVKILFDPRVRGKKNIEETAPGEYKFLPKGYETTGILDIVGDHIFMFNSREVGNFGKEGKIFVIVNKELANTYRTWFEMMWNLCAEN